MLRRNEEWRRNGRYVAGRTSTTLVFCLPPLFTCVVDCGGTRCSKRCPWSYACIMASDCETPMNCGKPITSLNHVEDREASQALLLAQAGTPQLQPPYVQSSLVDPKQMRGYMTKVSGFYLIAATPKSYYSFSWILANTSADDAWRCTAAGLQVRDFVLKWDHRRIGNAYRLWRCVFIRTYTC